AHVLLREAFAPMLTEFRSVVDKMPASEIQDIKREREKSTSIMISPFDRSGSALPTINLLSKKTKIDSGEKIDLRDPNWFEDPLVTCQDAFENAAQVGAFDNSFFTIEDQPVPEPSTGFKATTEAFWVASPLSDSRDLSLLVWSVMRIVTPDSAYGPEFAKHLL